MQRAPGQLTLRKLQLKKGALDKFRLPVDVLEGLALCSLCYLQPHRRTGHLGEFTLSLHWMNLGNQPVEILIKDVYLLVVPSTQSAYDPEEEEKRVHAAKMERLENAELLHMRGQAEQSSGTALRPSCIYLLFDASFIRRISSAARTLGLFDRENH